MTTPVSPISATLSDLMRTGVLSAATKLSSDRTGDPAVSALRVVRSWDELTAIARDDLVLLDLEAGQGGWMIDAAVRVVWERYAAGLIVGDHVTIFDSPARLADRFGVALFSCPIPDQLTFAIELGQQIQAPQAHLMQQAQGGVRSILDRTTPDDIATALRDALGNPEISVITLSGAAIVGSEIEDLDHAAVRTHDGPWPYAANKGRILVWPAQRHPAALELFLVTTFSSPPSPEWIDQVSVLFAAAASKLAQWSALETLDDEVDERRRSQFLTDLLGSNAAADPDVMVRGGRLGWTLKGWHLAFHMTFRGQREPQLLTVRTRRLRTQLADLGIDSPLVERSDGWSGWISTGDKHGDDLAADLQRNITKLLNLLPADPLLVGGIGLAGGIGSFGEGPGGLRDSLREARSAAQLAALSATPSVRSAEGLGVRQLLIEPLNGSQLIEMARTLLTPLAGTREGPILIMTLRAYLEAGASLIKTADALGVHRNTVSSRLRRIQAELSVDLDDPDDRLSLQLACRVFTG